MPEKPAHPIRSALSRPVSRRRMLGLMSVTAAVAVTRPSWSGNAEAAAPPNSQPPPAYHGIVGLL